MIQDDFKKRYTSVPVAIYRACREQGMEEVLAHQHREAEIISMTRGEADFYVRSQKYRVRTGDLLLIPPYALHRADEMSGEGVCYDCICLDFEVLCDAEWENGLEIHALIPKERPYAETLQKYVSAACTACERRERGWELETVGNLSLLFGLLKKNEPSVPNPKQGGKAEENFGQTVLTYLAENYAFPITSHELAGVLYLDYSYFCRLFKKVFGLCFSAYLLAYRLEKAGLMLLNTQKSVSEIAFSVGFNGCSYFSETFKARYGLSPRDYRNRRQRS